MVSSGLKDSLLFYLKFSYLDITLGEAVKNFALIFFSLIPQGLSYFLMTDMFIINNNIITFPRMLIDSESRCTVFSIPEI